MNYLNNQLEEITNKALFYNQFNGIDKKMSQELLKEFLSGLYSLFECVKNSRTIDGHLNEKVDFILYFRCLPVVVAKIIDIDADLDHNVKVCKNIFKLNRTIRYVIFSDGLRYIIYHNNEGTVMLYNKMDLTNLTEKDKIKYYRMSSMDIIHEIDEVLHKTHKISH